MQASRHCTCCLSLTHTYTNTRTHPPTHARTHRRPSKSRGQKERGKVSGKSQQDQCYKSPFIHHHPCNKLRTAYLLYFLNIFICIILESSNFQTLNIYIIYNIICGKNWQTQGLFPGLTLTQPSCLSSPVHHPAPTTTTPYRCTSSLSCRAFPLS